MAVNGTSNSNSVTAYSYLQYKNKISGLVSGMDIDSIMEKLMKAESAQMEKLQQQKQKYEWKRDAYREVNTSLDAFQKGLFDDYGLKSSWNTKTANISENSAVSVKANTSASGNLSISQVEVAKAAIGIFTSQGVAATRITKDTDLSNIVFSGVDGEEKNLSEPESGFNVFGVTSGKVSDVIDILKAKGYDASISNGRLTVLGGSTSVEADETTINSLKQIGVSVSFKYNSSALKVGEENATGSTKISDLGLDGTSLTIKVGDNEEKTINLDGASTIDDVLKNIKTETGLQASIQDGVISLYSTDAKDVAITNAPAELSFHKIIGATTSTTLFNKEDPTFAGNIKGTNTVQEVLGSTAKDGSFVIRAIQDDGSTKDTTISYKATDTIDSLISKINGSGAGVTALFNNGKFSVTANNTGERKDSGDGVSLVVSDTGSESNQLFEKLTNQSISSEGEVSLITEKGTNASMTVNGVTYKQSSNVFNISGYTITASSDLNAGLTEEQLEEPSVSKVTISSTNDTDKAIEKVKAFVETYNGLIKDLNTRVSEKKKVGYDPLTDAQKAEMTTSDIEKWETAAKAGLLKGDSTITSVLSKMRETIYSYGTSGSKGAKGDSLYSIGITTSKEWSDNGKLEIDTDKLRAAIEKDPDVLSRIFTGDGSEENPGIVSQLRDTAKEAITSIEKSAGKASTADEKSYSLGKTIADYTTKIDDWKDRLKDIEERYWNQFSAMEQAIQKANSQSSIFSSGSY